MSYEPSQRTTQQLLEDWAAIMRQLRDRGIIRTNNNPVGDIAEAIVAEHYVGQRAPFSQKNWDVLTATGERIEVSRRQGLDSVATASGRRGGGPHRGCLKTARPMSPSVFGQQARIVGSTRQR